MRPYRRETTALYPVWTNHLQNYMVQDLLGALTGVVAFAVVLYPPGYLVASATNLFGFRKASFGDRSISAIAASFCVVPIVAHLLGRTVGLKGLCWAFAATAIATAVLMIRTRHDVRWPRRDRRIALLFGVGWTAFVLIMLVDAQVGHRLYFSVVMADQSYRIAFTDAVARTGIPPSNPLYFAGSAAPMRYFYFWYVLCAAVMKLAHVSAAQAFTASSVWAGFGLLATVQLFTRHFFHWKPGSRWIALGLLVVTGADLLPAVGQAILQPSLNGNTEWWSVDPIFGWPDSLLWVPHHVASVLCCLLGFLLLWQRSKAALTGGAPERLGRRAHLVLAAFAFASAFGLSVYVAFGFALLMVAWLVRLWFRRDPGRLEVTQDLLIVAALSALCCVPFLHELAFSGTPSSNAGIGPGGHIFSLSFRRMIDSELLTGLDIFAPLKRSHPVLLDQGLRFLLLLPGLALELGVYGAVLVLSLLARRRGRVVRMSEAHNTALFFTLCGLGMTLVLSSSVITNNDFGYRAVMLPQFFLLLLTAELLGGWQGGGMSSAVEPTTGRRRLVYALLALGLAGTTYWAFLLRAWLPIEAKRPQSGFAHSPEDEFQIREAFSRLNRTAPQDAVVAFRDIDPVPDRKGAVMTPNEYYQRMLVMDSGRQMLNAEGKCATHFGGDPSRCGAIQQATAQLYGRPIPSSQWARQFCEQFGVHYLVLSAWDPQFGEHKGWPAELEVVAQEPRFRILNCR